MKRTKAHGGRAFNGLRMLLFQGIRSYEIWNDVSISDEIAGEILKGMEAAIVK